MITGRKTTVPGSNFQEIRVNDVAMTLSSIAITHAPTKTQYYISDDFEKAGMEVTATFTIEGGATFTKVVEDYSYSPRSFDTAGTIDVTVSYTYKGVTKTAIQQVTVSQATSYQISEELENGSLSGDTQIVEGETANVTIVPLEGAILPQVKEVVTVTGATLDSYNASTGACVLSNPTDGVVVSGRCPDEDTWMDTVAINGKTYRKIFATNTASGPKLMWFDGMTYYDYDKMEPYTSSGSTAPYIGLENADTLGRSLLIDNGPDGSRACFTINKNIGGSTSYWSGTKFTAGDSLFVAAKIKGGLVSGTRPAEPISTSKLGINQGSSGLAFGTCAIAELSDPNESEFSTWTTRSKLSIADKTMNAGYFYFGMPSLNSATVRFRYYVDNVFILNLTKIFGAGNIPTEEEMTQCYETFVTLWKSHNVAGQQ